MQSQNSPFNKEAQRIREVYRQRDRIHRPRYFEMEDAAHVLRIQQRWRGTRSLLHQFGRGDLSASRILDIGCGDGGMLLTYMMWGCQPQFLAGIDLREGAIHEARQRLPRSDLIHGCASRLPWADDSFDLVSAYTVFSSILDSDMRRAVAEEMRRVLKPNGCLILYDTRRNNPKNKNIRRLAKADWRQTLPDSHLRFVPLTFFPHWARHIPLMALEFLYPVLSRVPIFCSHWLIYGQDEALSDRIDIDR